MRLFPSSRSWPRPALALPLLLLGALPWRSASAQTYQAVTPIDATVGNGYVTTKATAIDAAGNTVTVGYFQGTIAFGSHVVSSLGRDEIFVAKQNPAGAWLWATRAGSYGDDRANGVALDASGNVLATGWFRSQGPNSSTSADFGATTLTSPGSGTDAWIGKLNGTTGAWLWATRGGGTGDEAANAIAADGAGNALVAGVLSGTGAQFGATTLSTGGDSDVLVGKLNGTTGAWVWAKRAGGTYYDEGRSIAVDGAGNAFITGWFGSANAVFGATTLHNTALTDSDPDIYVAKLNGATGAWLWAAAGNGSSDNITGASYDFGNGIAVDGAGNPLITGFVSGTTATFGALTLSPGNNGKVLAAKLNGTSGSWLWANINSGSANDGGSAITVDAAGNGLITGAVSSPDAQFGATMLTGASTQGSLLVTKVNGATGNWQWATLGGTAPAAGSAGTGIGVDGSGNPVATGNYSVYPNQDVAFGALTLPGTNNGNIVVGKLDGATGAWTRVTNASTSSGARSVDATAADAAGNVYITGTFSNTISFGATTLTCAGAGDIYVAKQAPNGTWLWAARAGSGTIYAETAKALALDASGNVLVTGEFGGAVLNVGPHTLVNSDGLNGSTDIWAAKLNGSTGAWLWATTMGNASNDEAAGAAVDGTGDVLLAVNIANGGDDFDLLTAKLNGATGALQWTNRSSGAGSTTGGGIAVDATGHAYVTGYLSGAMSFDAFNITSGAGASGALVGKLNGATGAWQWVTQGGSNGYNTGASIAVDGAGNPFITGYTAGGTFGALTLPTLTGHVLIAKLDGATGTWTWANYGGGNSSGQSGEAIAVDAAGNGFIAGSLRGGVASPFGATTLHPVDGATGTRQDALIAKFNGLTGAWLWAKSAGGGENDFAHGIAVDGSNHIYAVGEFLSTIAGFDATTLYGGQAASTGFLAKLLDQPTINTLSPAAAPVGTLVTATGTLLSGASLITFAGGATAVPTNVTATSFQFVIPNTANTGAVTVAATAGVGPSTSPLTVVRDLVVNAPATTVLPGPYRTITVTATGGGILGGDVTVSNSILVRTGGSLDDACHHLDGTGTFTVQTGATLAVCDAAGLALTGPTGMVRVTGVRTFAAGSSYIFDGTTAQITGTGVPAVVTNLTVSTPLGLDLTQNVAVRQLLTLTGAGDLRQPTGQVTLLSNATGTGLLVNGGAGRVLGTATVQRYINPTNNPGRGYRHLSSPVTMTTFDDLLTNGFTPRVNAVYNTAPATLTAANFPNIFAYDEARPGTTFDAGWLSPTVTTEAMTPGRGYAVSINGSMTPDFVGTLTQDDVTQSLTLNTGNLNDYKAGWQLLGNPFASVLNWDLVPVPAGMSGAMSVFRSTALNSGQYLVRVNGLGGMPDGLIAPGQGFFTRVLSDAPVSFTLPTAARSAAFTPVALQRPAAETRPLISLQLRAAADTVATNQDEAFVYFQAGATAALDAAFDGPRPARNLGTVPTLASLTATQELLAINGLPLTSLTTGTTVELLLTLPQAGAYTLTPRELRNLGATPVALLDRLTGTSYDLTATATVRFTVAQAGDVTGRFALIFGQRVLGTTAEVAAPTAGLQLWPNPTAGTSPVQLTGAPAGPVDLLDALGRVVRTVSARAEAPTLLPVAGLPAGVYVVRAGKQTSRLVVR